MNNRLGHIKVSGETLSQRIIRDDEISVYEIKTIAKAVLSALSFLHSQPIPVIHNEVTIQNVYFCSEHLDVGTFC